MPPQKVVLQYLKIRALAERGVQGERATAQRKAAELEQAHPGLREAAHRFQQQERNAQVPPKTGQKGPPRKSAPAETPQNEAPWSWFSGNAGPAGPGGPTGPGNWESIFSTAQAAVHGIYEFAQNVGQVVAGRQLAQQVRATTKVSRTGNLLITLHLSTRVCEDVLELNPLQLQAFKEGLHELLAEELDQLFGED